MKRYLLAASILAASTAAHADSLDYNSYGWYGVAIQIDSPTSIYGGAGQIQLYDNGFLVANAWCMDIANYLTGSGHDGVLPFTLATVTGGLPGVPTTTLSQTQLDTIANLVVNGDNAIQGGATATDSAAYQVAIWSVEYGNGFSYDSLGSAFASEVSGYIGVASIGGPPVGYTLSFFEPLDPAVSQTLVFARPSLTEVAIAAPEPSTWVMMALGFVGLGVAAGYRSRRSAYIAA
jgi:hypothetical protein